MASVEGYLLSLVAAAVLVAVADALTPKGMLQRVERLVGGLLMLLVLLRPAVEGWEGRLADALAGVYEQEAAWPDALEETDNQLLETLITQSTQAYIEREAQALGITCTAEVRCTWQEEIPVPTGVTITGSLAQEEQAALSALVAADLAIGVEEQIYREEEP